MKKVTRVLYAVFSIISLLMMFFGFYLFISNLGRDDVASFIFLGICIAGFLGLCLIAGFIMYRKNHPKKTAHKEDERSEIEENNHGQNG